MPKALFSALSHAYDIALPERVLCCWKRPVLDGTFTNAQMSIASHAGGTTKALITKSQRIFCGEMSIKGNYPQLESAFHPLHRRKRVQRTWMSQYKK